MSITKKALLIGIGSTLALGGVTTAIAVPLSVSNNNEVPKKETIAATLLNPAKDLVQIIKNIKDEDVLINPITKEETSSNKEPLARKDLYSFNVATKQLDLIASVKEQIPNTVKLEFEFNSSENTVTKLNEGKLAISIKAKVNEREIANKQLELNSFKAINEEIKGLIKQEENKAVIDLTNKKEASSFVTIESLNKEESSSNKTTELTKLFVENTKEEQSESRFKDWSIQGKIKLDRIATEEGKETPSFYLAKAKEVTYLKLVKTTDGQITEEALVDEIKINDLLASSIETSAVGIKEEENKQFLEEFNKDAKAAGYKTTEGVNTVELEIKKMGNEPVISTVLINPSALEKTSFDQDIKAHLVVNFGVGIDAKRYDTKEATDLKTLKDAGFSFSVYTKMIEGSKDKVLKVTDLTKGSELDTYFTNDHFTKPTDPMVFLMDSGTPMKGKGGFTKVDVTLMDNPTEINLGKATKKEKVPGQLDSGQETPINENWISFVSYSYKNKELMNKILLTPSISILHLEVKKPVTAHADSTE